MAGEMKPNHLLVNEINYELRIRGIETNRDIHDKRKILGKAIQKEKNRNIDLVDPKFVYETERREITVTLESIRQLVQDFEGPITDSVYGRIHSRLTHVIGRIKRMVIIAENGPEAELFKKESYATCLTLEAELDEHVTVDTTQPSTLGTPAPAPTTIVTIPESSKKVDIFKWDVKFDAESNTLGVKAFLERINELAEARHVSKLQLFESAVDLFSGNALYWFRHLKKSESIKNWDDLVSKLERDFLGSDYDEELWSLIKSRKQQKGEPAVIFIAIMESFFSQLSSPPAVVTKIKWMQRNLKGEYVKQLALNHYQSVEDLLKDVKILEEVLSEPSLENCKNNSSNVCNFDLNFDSEPVPSSSRGFNRNKKSSNFNSNKEYKRDYNSSHHVNYYSGGHNNSHRNSQNFVNSNIHTTSKTFKRFSNQRDNNENSKRAVQGCGSTSNVNVVETHGAIKKTICWNCKRPNHTFKVCRQKRNMFCYKCGKPDVTSRDCDRCTGNA